MAQLLRPARCLSPPVADRGALRGYSAQRVARNFPHRQEHRALSVGTSACRAPSEPVGTESTAGGHRPLSQSPVRNRFPRERWGKNKSGLEGGDKDFLVFNGFKDLAEKRGNRSTESRISSRFLLTAVDVAVVRDNITFRGGSVP